MNDGPKRGKWVEQRQQGYTKIFTLQNDNRVLLHDVDILDHISFSYLIARISTDSLMGKDVRFGIKWQTSCENDVQHREQQGLQHSRLDSVAVDSCAC